MANNAELILRTLDRHLTEPAAVRLYGGAAMILAYGRPRSTEDADLLMDDREAQVLIDHGFSEALEKANAELEAADLYIAHIFGPEQVILGLSWRDHCRPVDLAGLRYLSLTALGPIDMVLSKLGRGDEGDLADITWLLDRERLSADAVRAAVASAQVPEVMSRVFELARERLFAVLAKRPA